MGGASGLAAKEPKTAIRLIAAAPYKGFEARWSTEWQRAYQLIIEAADLVRYICPGYSRDAFQRRNEWMVDHSARVIAVYNGEPGGTRNTIAYAKNAQIEVLMV